MKNKVQKIQFAVLLTFLGLNYAWASPGDTLVYYAFDRAPIELDENSINAGQATYYAHVGLPKRKEKFHKVYGILEYGCFPERPCVKWDTSSSLYITHLELPDKNLPKRSKNGRYKRTKERPNWDGKIGPRYYELLTWITPFGSNRHADDDFRASFSFDLTDFSSILRDSVEVAFRLGGFYGFGTEGLEVTVSFHFIEGTPAREAISVEPLRWGWKLRSPDYPGRPADQHSGTFFGHGIYEKTRVEKYLAESSLTDKEKDDKRRQWKLLNEEVFLKQETLVYKRNRKTSSVRLRIVQWGSGAHNQNDTPCMEFCPGTRTIYYNGRQLLGRKRIWRGDCGLTATYPQAGTWPFDRAGWCPGDLVIPDEYDFFVSTGKEFDITLSMQPFYLDPAQKKTPRYQITGNVIQYGKPAFGRDVAVDDVKAPNDVYWYRRLNPICGGPIIVLKNNGTERLNTVDIRYGIVRGGQETVWSKTQWRGRLGFMEKKVVEIDGLLDWKGGPGRFEVHVSNPNGREDQYPLNNVYRTNYVPPPSYAESKLKIKLKTNFSPKENWMNVKRYGVKRPIYERKDFDINKKVEEAIKLKRDACYIFTFSDEGPTPGRYKDIKEARKYGDGLFHWYRALDGKGSLEIENEDVNLGFNTVFEPDFGSRLTHYFTIEKEGPEDEDDDDDDDDDDDEDEDEDEEEEVEGGETE
ncbi:MAG: peptide-N-glycosidase F-related protein [Cytophagales bacterium]|nr:peptide-N-glycosidase F-related protein [Cytophagales bacterium]